MTAVAKLHVSVHQVSLVFLEVLVPRNHRVPRELKDPRDLEEGQAKMGPRVPQVPRDHKEHLVKLVHPETKVNQEHPEAKALLDLKVLKELKGLWCETGNSAFSSP